MQIHNFEIKRNKSKKGDEMLENLTDDQVVILTELVVNYGMYRYKKNSYKYLAYHKIAEELLEEVIKVGHKYTKQLISKFIDAQLKTKKEIEVE